MRRLVISQTYGAALLQLAVATAVDDGVCPAGGAAGAGAGAAGVGHAAASRAACSSPTCPPPPPTPRVFPALEEVVLAGVLQLVQPTHTAGGAQEGRGRAALAGVAATGSAPTTGVAGCQCWSQCEYQARAYYRRLFTALAARGVRRVLLRPSGCCTPDLCAVGSSDCCGRRGGGGGGAGGSGEGGSGRGGAAGGSGPGGDTCDASGIEAAVPDGAQVVAWWREWLAGAAPPAVAEAGGKESAPGLAGREVLRPGEWEALQGLQVEALPRQSRMDLRRGLGEAPARMHARRDVRGYW